ncbi:hypothetical protein GBAG_3689 [Buttiauxella agrestis ATCC 33320]|uniref:Uncharacterized protein n=1 Tax=Buttiauxella agrestis ATCC 33320 TaxID=1006004 RepID=A0A085G1X1_9ENTR|nr:hypothetical protein GBAG_3689 [Buttiauxella agrestis ATCC 33320]
MIAPTPLQTWQEAFIPISATGNPAMVIVGTPSSIFPPVVVGQV